MVKKKIVEQSKYLLLYAILVLSAVAIIVITLFVNYVKYLRTAHSTFENYYTFRGCIQLLQKTNTYAYCKQADGRTIKLVLYNNRWYLDGDLPVCTLGICL